MRFLITYYLASDLTTRSGTVNGLNFLNKRQDFIAQFMSSVSGEYITMVTVYFSSFLLVAIH